MDTIEKVLNSLIDSMHKHIAKGNGQKKVNLEKAIEASVDVAPKARELTEFDKFLIKAKDDKVKNRRVEMTVGIATPPSSKKRKK